MENVIIYAHFMSICNSDIHILAGSKLKKTWNFYLIFSKRSLFFTILSFLENDKVSFVLKNDRNLLDLVRNF